ncbi:MAG: hypothetical protein UW69_C0059G0002 [Microgenomates group bacterium GW2011_GWA2_44_7]|nr:MAG: hypothetical protein UW69_C0059G0002 [Microgenomates group bacterium GW2011_GWA2_44_7]KKT77702.1 MAG: hypothetical protein UW73_C0014G0025 [Microgenomates group bacterium GW2011_GWB1_44_8]
MRKVETAEIIRAFKETEVGKQIPLFIEVKRMLELATGEALCPNSTGIIERSGPLIYTITDNIDLICFREQGVPAAIKVAMLWAAVSYEARPEADLREAMRRKPLPRFSEIGWKPGSITLQIAREAEAQAKIIRPQTKGKFTEIDLGKMRDHMENGIQLGKTELIVVAGPNGVGKTSLVAGLASFAQSCGLEISSAHFPRRDGPLGHVNNAILKGETQMTSEAKQMVFLADALDFPMPQSTFLICDRFNPFAEGFVYGPKEGNFDPFILAAREQFNMVPWVFILDRHPALCFDAIKKRGGERRIYEQSVEQLISQQLRFWALFKVPGTVGINVDIPPQEQDEREVIMRATQKAIVAAINRGILQRALVRQTKYPDYTQADDAVWTQYRKWYLERPERYRSFLENFRDG